MNRPFLFALALATPSLAFAESTAFDAAKAVPKTHAKGVSRLIAPASATAPSHWIVLVHDDAAPNGVREFVVNDGTVTRFGEGSEFAPVLSSANRLTFAKLKVDSTQATQLAAEYAKANALEVAALEYELRQDGNESGALWTVSVFDKTETKLGSLTIAANDGRVVSHPGFAVAPAGEASIVAPALAAAAVTEVATSEKQKTPVKKKTSSSSKSRNRDDDDDDRDRNRPSTFRRIGGHLKNFFRGR
jgi:hypothetical protein